MHFLILQLSETLENSVTPGLNFTTLGWTRVDWHFIWQLKFCSWENSTIHAMVAVCCAVYDQHFHGTFWVAIATLFEKLVGYHSRKLNLSQDCHWMSGCFHWWIFRDRLDVSDWLQSDIIQLIELASRYRGCHEPPTAPWCCYREVK